MPFQRLRRAVLVAAFSVAGLLAACGGGQVVSQFSPSRVVVFGDAMADAGQAGGARYTVNGTSSSLNWTEVLANNYSLSVAPASAGGTSYARGSALVATRPDAAGNAAVPSISEQIDTFFAGNALGGRDLVIVNAGVGDIIAQMASVAAGTISAAQAQANVEAAGRALGAQVRRLANAGGTHVAVAGPYNLGRSPWAIGTGQTGVLQTLSSRFNEELLISIADLGDKVLYVDAALYFNLLTANPSQSNLSNATVAACNSVDPGAGIGIGTGHVNSALCTLSTIVSGYDPATSIFADEVYFTPQANYLWAQNAFQRLRTRW